MSVGFFLAFPTKENSSIDMIVRHNGVRYKRAIGVTVKTSKWNSKSQRAKVTQDYPEAADVNVEIQRQKSAIERLLTNTKRPEITDKKHFWALADCELGGRDYDNIASTNLLFLEYFNNVFIRRFSTTKSESRIKRLKATSNMLKRYEEHSGKAMTFTGISVAFYRDLEAYFAEKRYSPNYFGAIIKIIKQVMREASAVDGIKVGSGFCSAIFKVTSSNVDSVYLSDEELKRIHALQIDDKFIDITNPKSQYSGRESLKRSYLLTKNLFLIGAYTGLRLSDFKRLQPEHIANGKITIVTEKTNQRVVIPIHPVVRDILDGGFDFNDHLSEQKIRMYIKDVCRVAKIDGIVEVRRSSMAGTTVEQLPKYKLVSTHTARRSFATNAYKAGVPTLAIMKITGHTKESTFMKYIRISGEENADMLSNHPFFKY